MNSDTVVLVGGESSIGRDLNYFFSKKSVNVISTSRNLSRGTYFDLDVVDSWKNLFSILEINEIKAIFLLANRENSAGDISSENELYHTNVTRVKELLLELEKFGVLTVFLSSSHVFSGKSRRFAWDADYNPCSSYGEFKVDVERYIITNKLNVAIVRATKVVTSDFYWFHQAIKNSLSGKVEFYFSNVNISPISSFKLFSFLLEVIRINQRLIYQISGAESHSFYHVIMNLILSLNKKEQLAFPGSKESNFDNNCCTSLKSFSHNLFVSEDQALSNVFYDFFSINEELRLHFSGKQQVDNL